MKIYARTIFRELDELVLFMFNERHPAEEWKGGVCELIDCSETDIYRRFALGRGAELKAAGRWMTVGKSQLRVMDLVFHRQ